MASTLNITFSSVEIINAQWSLLANDIIKFNVGDDQLAWQLNQNELDAFAAGQNVMKPFSVETEYPSANVPPSPSNFLVEKADGTEFSLGFTSTFDVSSAWGELIPGANLGIWGIIGGVSITVTTGGVSATLNTIISSPEWYLLPDVGIDISIPGYGTDTFGGMIVGYTMSFNFITPIDGGGATIPPITKTSQTFNSGDVFTETINIPQYNGGSCTYCGTWEVSLVTTDSQGDTSSTTTSQFSIEKGIYGCTDNTAKDGTYQPSSTHPNGTCRYDAPLCRVGISEIHPGTDKIPDWIELFNPTDTDIDLNNYRIQIVNGSEFSSAHKFTGVEGINPGEYGVNWEACEGGGTQKGLWNNGFVEDSMGVTNTFIPGVPNSGNINYLCSEDSQYHSFLDDCEQLCDGNCEEIPHAGKFWVIGNDENNRCGLFFESRSPSDFQFDWGQLVKDNVITSPIANKINITFTDFNISENDTTQCPDNFWNPIYNSIKYPGSLSSIPGRYILLWNDVTDGNGENLECVFCYDDNTGGGETIDLSPGSVLQFNTAKAYDPKFDNEILATPEYWYLSGTAEDSSEDDFMMGGNNIDLILNELNFNIRGKCNDLETECDIDQDCSELGLGTCDLTLGDCTYGYYACDFGTHSGTPLDVNKNFSQTSITDQCTDIDAINYICKIEEYYTNPLICPNGNGFAHSEIFVSDTDEQTYCQFQYTTGCIATDALNYICGDNGVYDDDYCTSLNGDIRQNCCLDDDDEVCNSSCVTDDGTCEYPVTIWFDNVDRDSSTFEVWIYTNLPVTDLGTIRMDGVAVTGISDRTPSISGSKFVLSSLETEINNSIPSTMIDLDHNGTDLPSTGGTWASTCPDNQNYCNAGQKLFTASYDLNLSWDLSNNIEISLDTIFLKLPNNDTISAESIIHADFMYTDCDFHPYKLDGNDLFSLKDRCNTCYVVNNDFSIDDTSLGCWNTYVSGETAPSNLDPERVCTHCKLWDGTWDGSACDACVGCDGAVNNKIFDSCGICDGLAENANDGIPDGCETAPMSECVTQPISWKDCHNQCPLGTPQGDLINGNPGESYYDPRGYESTTDYCPAYHCVGGNTGLVECTQDCANMWGTYDHNIIDNCLCCWGPDTNDVTICEGGQSNCIDVDGNGCDENWGYDDCSQCFGNNDNDCLGNPPSDLTCTHLDCDGNCTPTYSELNCFNQCVNDGADGCGSDGSCSINNKIFTPGSGYVSAPLGYCNCNSGYFGEICDSLCPGFNGSDAGTICGGHGTCDNDNSSTIGGGTCTCECPNDLDGGANDDCWQGDDCTDAGTCDDVDNCSGGFCTSTCGTCTEPNVCTCNDGWSGENCGTPICTDLCGNHGICTDVDTCTCHDINGLIIDTPVWETITTQCDTPICVPECENGTCTWGGVGENNYCDCESNWGGEACEFTVCNGVNSTNIVGYYVTNEVYARSCDGSDYVARIDGDFDLGCELAFPEMCGDGSCTGPEENIGIDGTDVGCTGAQSNWTYVTCFTDTIYNSYCINGLCDPEGDGDGLCTCEDGWSGVQCDVVDECLVDCANGTCTVNPQTCTCNENYFQDSSGTISEGELSCDWMDCGDTIVSTTTYVDGSGNNPCSHNGECKTAGGYCTCQVGDNGFQYTDNFCETQVCGAGCQNNTDCIDGDTYPTCDCAIDVNGINPAWEGIYCQTPLCQGGGNCDGYGVCLSPNNCDCNDGYYGGDDSTCEVCPNIVCSGNGECADHALFEDSNLGSNDGTCYCYQVSGGDWWCGDECQYSNINTCGDGSNIAFGTVNCETGKCTCSGAGGNYGNGYCGTSENGEYFVTPGNTENCNYSIDECYQCNGRNNEKDCLGNCQYLFNGDSNPSYLGSCGVGNNPAGGDGSSGTPEICGRDECGICNGNNYEGSCINNDSCTHMDCAGVCDGDNGYGGEMLIYYYDSDGDGWGAGDGVSYCSTTVSSEWVEQSGDLNDSIECFSNEIDICGVCDGGNGDVDCTGPTNEFKCADDTLEHSCTAYLQECGTDSYCIDTACFNDAFTDDCGICACNDGIITETCFSSNIPNICSSGEMNFCPNTFEGPDYDCSGQCFGDNTLDECGTCDNDPSNNCETDCNGEWGGIALEDVCGTCHTTQGSIDNNWNNACFPRFFFGNIDDESGLIDFGISAKNQIGYIDWLPIEIIYKPGTPKIQLIETTYQWDNDQDNETCPEGFTITKQSDSDIHAIYRIQACSGDGYLFGEQNQEIRYTTIEFISYSESSYTIGFEENFGNISIFYDEPYDDWNEYPVYFGSMFPQEPIEINRGCMDPYATNCNAANPLCECNPSGVFTCVTANKWDECTYPSIEFKNYNISGVETLIDDTCNFSQVDGQSQDFSCDSEPIVEIFPFDESGALLPLNNFQYNIDYLFTDNDNDLFRPSLNYSIDQNRNSLLNTVIGRSVKSEQGNVTILCENGEEEQNCTNTIHFDNVEDISGYDSDYFNIISNNKYWGYESNCGGNGCPYNGSYILSLEWPWNWQELYDPMTGELMSQPRVMTKSKFTVKKGGCIDDSVNNSGYLNACNYNSSLTHDCEDVLGGDNYDCCTYRSPNIVSGNCCLESEMDSCGYCEGDLVNNVSVWAGVGLNPEVTWYSDIDGDFKGCGDDALTECPHICPLTNITGGSGCYQIKDYFTLNNGSTQSLLWSGSATLTHISDEYCNCPGNIDIHCSSDAGGSYDGQHCTNSCSNNSYDYGDFILAINANTLGSSVTISDDCNDTDTYGVDGYCINDIGGNYCTYVDNCGLCLRIPILENIPLYDETSYLDIIPGSSNKDCNGVCFPYTLQFYDINTLSNEFYDINLVDGEVFGSYTSPSCGECVIPNTESQLEDLCGVCSGQCIGENLEGETPGEISFLYDSNCDGISDDCGNGCYVWESGGCHNCLGINVGVGGDSLMDDCGVCEGDNVCNGEMTNSDQGRRCVCADGNYDCFYGNDLDCAGICFGNNESDSYGGCCLIGELKTLYPDLDETSIDDGDCISDFQGCSGEVGICSDGSQILSDNGTPPNYSCLDGGIFYPSNTINVCDLSSCIETGDGNGQYGICYDLNSISQPDSDGNYSTFSGWYHSYTDLCDGYGPDLCGQCWEDASFYNINVDCNGFCSCDGCPANCGSEGGPGTDCGFELDNCGICYDTSQFATPPNDCKSCLNPEAINFVPGAYIDCSGGNDIPVDYSCCQYPAPTIFPLGTCEYPLGDGSYSQCENDSQCGNLGECLFGVIWDGLIKSEYPITLNWLFDIQNNVNNDYETFTIYRNYPELYHCILDGTELGEDAYCGSGCNGEDNYCTRYFTPLTDIVSSTNGNYTFVDNLVYPPSMDLNNIPSNEIGYFIKSNDNHSLSDVSNIINIEIDTFEISFTHSFVGEDGTPKESFSPSDRIWIKTSYSNVPLNMNNSFTILFDPENVYGWKNTSGLNQFSYLPPWSDGTDDFTVETGDGSESKYFCPAPMGTWIEGDGGGDKIFNSKINCENNGCEDTLGISIECVAKYDIYLDISEYISNNAISQGHLEDPPESGQYPIPSYLYYPTGFDEDVSQSYSSDILNISIVKGCFDPLSYQDPLWIGPCTCETCSLTCGSCVGQWNSDYTNYWTCKDNNGTFTSYCDSWDGDVLSESGPEECQKIWSESADRGFYNPLASYDNCTDGDGNPTDYECTSNYDCIETYNIPNGKCNASCNYPIIGCLDDGVLPPSTPNNQGGTGSVLEESYKCENLEGFLIDYGDDSNCEYPVGGINGLCYGASGTIYLEYNTENECDECGNYGRASDDAPCIWVRNVECEGDCRLLPSPAINYVEGIFATYDPYGECLYSGCLNPDASNYSVPPSNVSEYGLENGYNTWITNASCLIPFNYSLQWEVRENNVLVPSEPGISSSGILSMERDENGYCYDETGDLIPGINSSDVCTSPFTWEEEPILIRKTKENLNKTLKILLIGGEGWNCLGDDTGALYQTQELCNESCLEFIDDPNCQTYTCVGFEEFPYGNNCEAEGNPCGPSTNVCENLSDVVCDPENVPSHVCSDLENHEDCITEPWLGCGNGAECIECGECRPNYGICTSNCGNCTHIGTSNRNSVWYQTEEYPFTFGSFTITDGLLQDGSGYYYDDSYINSLPGFNTYGPHTTENNGQIDYSAGSECELAGDECVIFNLLEQPANELIYDYSNLSYVDHQFAVTIKDPRDLESVKTKRLNVRFIRNDNLPIFEGLMYNGTLLDLDGGMKLDVGYEEDTYIFPIAVTDDEYNYHGVIENHQIDNYYFSIKQTPDSDNLPELDLKIDGNNLVITSPETTGHWTATVYLNQIPYQSAPDDLDWYYKGILQNCSCNPHSIEENCSCSSYTFEIDVVDTSGPEGVTVSTTIPSFGVSPDTYLIEVKGGDNRERLWFGDAYPNGATDEGIKDWPNPNYGGWSTKASAKWVSEIIPYCDVDDNSVNSYDLTQCESYGTCDSTLGDCTNGNTQVEESECRDYGLCQNGESTLQESCLNIGDCYCVGPTADDLSEISTNITNDECIDDGECVSNGGSVEFSPYTWSQYEWVQGFYSDTLESECVGEWEGYKFIEGAPDEDFNNGEGWDFRDTVWRYDIWIHKCTFNGEPVSDNDCLDDDGSGIDYIDYKSFADWTISSPFELDSLLNDYYPSIFSMPGSDIWSYENNGNTYTNRWLCPNGSYCGDNEPELYCNDEICTQVPEQMNLPQFVQMGYAHRFNEEGRYRIRIESYDLHYDPLSNTDINQGTSIGVDDVIVNVEYVIPIVQSLENNYLPWQGINIPNNKVNFLNTKNRFESEDVDPRPQLGCFTYPDKDDSYKSWVEVSNNNFVSPFNVDSNPITDDGNDNIFVDSETEFLPDVDIRTNLSLRKDSVINSGKYSTLFRYYDKDLQPLEYEETTGPAEVQFFFYPRESGSLFDERDYFDDRKTLSTYYIANVDWGDGTDKEYTNEPYHLGWGQVLKHSYDRPGLYQISGRMIRVSTSGSLFTDSWDVSDIDENIIGVEKHKRFEAKFFLNKNTGYTDEFESIGGDDYTYIPYDKTVPVIGGLSEHSLYAKHIKRQLGYVGNSTNPYDLNFKNYMDRLDSEYALSLVNAGLVGDEISKFTGSYASEWSANIADWNDVDIYGYNGIYDTVNSANVYRGFYSGSIDTSGQLTTEEKPILIHNGLYKHRGEFGDHLGEVDIGQVRFFDNAKSMWEMLGFTDVINRMGEEMIKEFNFSETNDNNWEVSSNTFFEYMENIEGAKLSNNNFMCLSVDDLPVGDDPLFECITEENQDDEAPINKLPYGSLCFDDSGNNTCRYKDDFYIRQKVFNDIIDTPKNYQFKVIIEKFGNFDESNLDGIMDFSLMNGEDESTKYLFENADNIMGFDHETIAQDSSFEGVEGHVDASTGAMELSWTDTWPKTQDEWDIINLGDGVENWTTSDEIFFNINGITSTHIRIKSISIREIINQNSNVETEEEYLLSHPGVPNSPRYWKNIIPEYYEVSTDFIIGIDINEDGTQFIVDEDQYWLTTGDGNTPYYPVVPLIDASGKFTEIMPYDIYLDEVKKVFGDPERNWNEDDVNSSVTNKSIIDRNLIIDLDFDSVSDNSVEDLSGNQNKGIVIGDYALKYEDGTRKPSRNEVNFNANVSKENPFWK